MADTQGGGPKVENADGGGRRRGRKGKGRGKGDRDRDRERAAGDGERGNRDSSRKGGGGRGGKGRDRDRDRDRGRNRSEAPLTAGLFAGVADREMPCRISGCTNTWTWFGTQQIRSLGKPEPKRMCSEHLAQFEGIEDREMPCRNSWCTRTWTWSRGAQLYQRERQEKLKPPHRLCEACFNEEKTTDDIQIECKIPECRNTWLWPRQAQLRHRAWVRRQQAKIDAEESGETSLEEGESAEAGEGEPEVVAAAANEAVEAEAAEAVEAEAAEAVEAEAAEAVETQSEQADASASEADASASEADASASEAVEARTSGKKRKRRRKRKRKIHEGPPEKLCERCFERMGHLEPIEVPCKVHGCTNTWAWEREGQLRAWAILDSREDVTELPQPPRRMCNSCFEFVRSHTDREVVCGRPECEKTWTYKTGAQLQDFLAGRTQDPIRLCEECVRSQFVVRSARGVELPAGAEVMPCMTSGCEGSWVYAPGMTLSAADPDATEPPVDRLCDDCRIKAGEPGRDPRRVEAAPADSSEETPEAEGEAAIEEAGASDPPPPDADSEPASEAEAEVDASGD